MKRLFQFFALALCCSVALAQSSGFEYKFYGQIRADLFYNSRANNETVDGLFYMYPKDNSYDADGNDLNGGAQGSMYMLYSRLGLDITGPDLGSAKTSAKVEVDFRGSGTSYAMPRIRHAYVNLAWTHSQLLVGQTWHPLFGEVSPSMFNLSTGAPFQPFSRAPQIRYRLKPHGGVQITAAAVWQQQYASAGPDGKSPDYLKNSCIPELYASLEYKDNSLTAGVAAELMSLCPRKKSVVDGKVYKVDERVTSVSLQAYAKYTSPGLMISGKTTLADNLTQTSMLGGFAVTAIDPRTGKMDYTPFRHSMTWLNVVCGKKWKPGFFVGYLKNLGTGKAITGQTYGVGLDVDQLLSVNAQLSYNLPHWRFGVEAGPSTAWYGKTDLSDGKVVDTHSVTNIRVLGVMLYIF